MSEADLGHTGEAPLLEVRDATVRFATRTGSLLAVDRVSFDIGRGETLGIVGESGSGKSVLVRGLMGLLPRSATIGTGTSIRFDGSELVHDGRVEAASLWGRRIAMIFQDPMTSLNPVKRIGVQLTEVMRAHLGYDLQRAKQRATELLDEVGISDPGRRLRQYPHEMSGGMRQRIMIAMALICDPELLIADEPTTALDVTVQRQVLELLEEVQQRHHMAVIFISHDLGVVSEIADRVAVMYAGQFVEQAAADDLFTRVTHPYTEALLQSMPRVDGRAGVRLSPIPGQLPNMTSPPFGCRFAERCR
ncbi:MAG TPA: ABC transporter ATP-binding protein, partial [Ilumatobacteraceae bacterium]|nr:ABC transporter ATP-binding protein [Ilumatobacteraceae bacterium]